MNTKYEFQDFTEDEYLRLLRIAKKNFTFTNYRKLCSTPGQKLILWRHDVDFSLNRAASLAKIEADEGVSATYFIRTRGDAYSILEAQQKNLVHRILDLGHEIGLHFELSDILVSSVSDLEKLLEREKVLFMNEFGFGISSFSFHNPTPELLAFSDVSYSGLFNAYADRFFSEVNYVSDSNGYWRFDQLESVLKDGSVDQLQVLTHPEWWVPEAMSPFERVKRAAHGRAEAFLASYEEGLADSGRENVR